MLCNKKLGALGLLSAIIFVPSIASALTLVQVAELFNIFVGLLLTIALLTYFTGLGSYFARLGTWPNYRDFSIKIMEWGVVSLFVLVVIVAVVQFFQKNPKMASIIVVSIALLIALIAAIYVAAITKGAKKKEE